MKTSHIIPALFLVAIGFGCSNDKNNADGPVYRGEKGVVIRGSNQDDRDQMHGSADSLHADSLQNTKSSTTPHRMENGPHK